MYDTIKYKCEACCYDAAYVFIVIWREHRRSVTFVCSYHSIWPHDIEFLTQKNFETDTMYQYLYVTLDQYIIFQIMEG